MMTAARQHYSVSIIPSGLVLNKAEKDLSQVGVVSPNLCEKKLDQTQQLYHQNVVCQ